MSLLSWENSTPRKLDIRNLTLMSSTIVMLAHLSQLTSMVLYSLYDWVTQRKNAEFGSWVGQMAQKKKRKTESAPLLLFMIEDFLGLASKLHYHGLCWGLFFNCSTVQFLFLLTYPSLNSLCVYFFWNHSSIKQLVYRSSTWSLFPGNQETTLCINIIMMY